MCCGPGCSSAPVYGGFHSWILSRFSCCFSLASRFSCDILEEEEEEEVVVAVPRRSAVTL